MRVDTTHTFFLAWLHQTSELVRFQRIDLHFDIPSAVIGTIPVWAGKVQFLFLMHDRVCPEGQLFLTLEIPELGEKSPVTFACTASAADLRRASTFLYDFSHQVSTPQTQELPAVVIEDLTNVTMFPKQALGPWYRRYQDAFVPNINSSGSKSSDAMLLDALKKLPDYTPQRHRAAVLPFRPEPPPPPSSPPSPPPSIFNRWLTTMASYYETSTIFQYSCNAVFFGMLIVFIVWIVSITTSDLQERKAILIRVRSGYPALQHHFRFDECRRRDADRFHVLACHHQMVKDAFLKNNGPLALQYLVQVEQELAQRGYDD